MRARNLSKLAIAVLMATAIPGVYAAVINTDAGDVTVTDGDIDNSSGKVAISAGGGHTVTVIDDVINARAQLRALQIHEGSHAVIGQDSSFVTLSANTPTADDQYAVIGIYASGGSDVRVSGRQINITGESSESRVYGYYLSESKSHIGTNASTVTISGQTSGSSHAYGTYVRNGAESVIDGREITIEAITGTTGEATAVRARLDDDSGDSDKPVMPEGQDAEDTTTSSNVPSRIVIGSADTKKITITAKGNEDSYGVENKKSFVTITADEVMITSTGVGVQARNSTEDETAPTNRATTAIKAGKTTINAGDIGIYATSNGLVDISGDLTVTAPHVIETRGYSTININTDGASDVVLNGHIVFEGYDANDVIDSDVNVRLTTPASSWTGNAFISTSSESQSKTVTGLKIELANGAQWTPTKYADIQTGKNEKAAQSYEYVGVSNLTLNGGVINIGSVDQTLQIKEMSGTGGTVHAATQATQNGFITAKLSIGELTAGSKPAMTVVYDGIDSDSTTAEAFKSLKSVTVGESKERYESVQVIPQGDIKGALVRTYDANGEYVDAYKANTKQDAYQSLTAMNVLSWRHDMNDLTKRMGELRDSPEGIGSWVRIYGSEQEYSGQTTRKTSIQVGTDFPVGDEWKVGAALSYTNGDTTYDGGDADSDAYSGAIYGSWLSESGQFVDLIAKYTRMSSDFSLNGFDGSQDNDALSISAEYGWHLKLNDMLFVEPQAELTYGRVFGDTFDGQANHAMTIDQDDFDSLIGRIGIRTGLYFPDNKGTVYARVSGAYDFQGEFEYKATNAATSQKFKDDLGGAWIEYAVGANFNWTENTYTYVDLERTSGGEVRENYRWNIGLRHVW